MKQGSLQPGTQRHGRDDENDKYGMCTTNLRIFNIISMREKLGEAYVIDCHEHDRKKGDFDHVQFQQAPNQLLQLKGHAFSFACQPGKLSRGHFYKKSQES